MSPARPTRWAVAGCGTGLVELLGAALRDSDLVTAVAVLAEPAAWGDPGTPERLARLLDAELLAAPDFVAAGAEATYLAADEHLLRSMVRAGSAILMEPPVSASAGELPTHGPSPLLATAHLLRWHPVAVSASDAVEAGEVGDVLSAEIELGPPPGLAALLGALDVIGFVLGDDVATLQSDIAEPGKVRWRGRTRGGVPVHLHATGPATLPADISGAPPGECSARVTGTKGQITAVMMYPGGRLRLDVAGHAEIIPVAGTDPVRVLVDRFSRAALGASPWGWSFARDLRLQALARHAATMSAKSPEPAT